MQNTANRQLLITILKTHSLRVTSARKAVFDTFITSDIPLSIQQVVDKTATVNIVTIYRIIDTFLKIGIIKQVPIGFKNKYELSDDFKPHHHHVTCESCGTSVAVHNDAIEQLMNVITQEAMMQPTKHHFEAYGICVKCSIV